MLDSIECKKAFIKARRVNPGRPSTNASLKCLVYSWKLQESAQAEIAQELDPKVAIIDPASKLDLGHKISGKLIEGFSTKLPAPARVGPDSSRHRGQFSEASGFVYCKVQYPYYELSPLRLLLPFMLV